MSDAAALLRQRARQFQEQQRKREASKAAAVAPAHPSSAAASTAAPSSASSAPAGAPKVAFAASYDDDSTAEQLRRPPKRPPPSLDSADETSPAKKAKLSPALNGSAEPPTGSDPLDAFMSHLAGRMSEEEKAALAGKPSPPPPSPSPSTSSPAEANGGSPPPSSSTAVPGSSRDSGGLERFYGDDEGVFDEDELDAIAREALDDPKSKVKKKELHAVDHSTYPYIPIRKAFWIEARDIAALSDKEIDERRRVQLEGVKIRGKNCPRPFFEWSQCGLSAKVAEVIAASGYTRPFPIQSQAIPVIMSGRDSIACAKTGSGSVLPVTALSAAAPSRLPLSSPLNALVCCQ